MRPDRFLFSCFFALLICLAISCQPQVDISIKIKRLSDRVVVFECLDANVTAINGNKGLAIVDTQRAPSIMLELKKLIEKEFAGKEILYVINTHAHWDHCSGNRFFPASMLVGHENCREFILRNRANTLQNICAVESHLNELKKQLKGLAENSQQVSGLQAKIDGWEMVLEDLRKGYPITPPLILFKDSLSLDLGHLTLKLIYCGGNAHTDNDIFVYVPEEQILLSGDIFTSASSFGFPVNKMIDVPEIISSINQVLQQEKGIRLVIPSHSDFFPGSELEVLRDILRERFGEFEGRESVAQYLEKMIEESGLESALKRYKEMDLKQDSTYYWMQEEFNMLGKRLLQKGKTKEATEVFKISVERLPNSALAYLYLGEVYLKQGQTRLAIENYEKSLSLFPQNEIARRILEQLRKQR